MCSVEKSLELKVQHQRNCRVREMEENSNKVGRRVGQCSIEYRFYYSLGTVRSSLPCSDEAMRVSSQLEMA